jgi:aspartate aminotransferase-like enzyme
MPTESAYARKQKEEIARAINRIATIEQAVATGDTWVRVTTETGTRTLPVAIGSHITPGDQVLVIETGGGAVVLCAITASES